MAAPICPRCKKSDQVEIISHNKISKTTKLYCRRDRVPFEVKGLKG